MTFIFQAFKVLLVDQRASQDFNADCRELALLSINSFQKDLAATNQLIRALALRVMTGIRVHDIIQIQMIAVKKCAGDK